MLVGTWPSFTLPLLHSQTPPVYPLGTQRLTSVARNRMDPPQLAGTSNVPPQREPLSESKNSPLAQVSSCIDRASIFFKVLIAPYLPPIPKKLDTEPPLDPHENELYSSFVDWSRQPVRADSPESDDPDKQAVPPTFEHKHTLVYRPHGQWAWANGLPINDTVVLSHLGTGRMCSATIKSGNLGGRHITFISKSWPTLKQSYWQGFHSELALYKSDQYLRPLQGSVVPTVIGVHVLPGEINIAMEPPHHSFWMEASPDMPVVLKERCIEAFEKLHSIGILHGDVELRHMLIGGDGKVTIIDFQCSRALIPNDDVMLQKAEPADFLMEMRKVKYKLNYGNSREKEYRKVMKSEERAARNKARSHRHHRRSRGERTGYISDYEHDSKEDKAEPPVHKQDWNEHWVEGADATPRRFVMPGQTPEQLEEEVHRLLAVISRMQLEKDALSSGRSGSQNMSTPPPTPTIPSALQENVKPSPDNGSRKRKATISPPAASTKRSRTSSSELHSATNFPCDGPASFSSRSVPDLDDAISPSLTATTSHSLLRRASHSSESSVPESVEDNADLGSSSSTPHFPIIKVRDFAYETGYGGPTGYYVPHPPTEARAAKERRWHIAHLNALKCFEENLPHPRALTLGDEDVIHFEKGKKLSVQLGTLKRAREDMENPDGARLSSARKKAKYMLEKNVVDGEATTNSEIRDGDALQSPPIPDEFPDIPDGPKILSRAEYESRVVSTLPSAPKSNRRGILRNTLPAKVISHHNEDWIGSQLEKSPKLGPVDLFARTVGNSSVMLGVHYGSHADDGDGTPPNSPPPQSRQDRANDVVAFAALGMKLTGPRIRPPKPRLANPRHTVSESLAGSSRLKSLIKMEPPQRKKVKYGASREQSSSIQSQTTVKIQPSSPPPLDITPSHSAINDSEDESDELEVETLLQPTNIPVSPLNWFSALFLRIFHT